MKKVVSNDKMKSTIKSVTTTENIQNVVFEPPDGGYGWFVVIGSIIVLALAAMAGPCFGILFSRPLLEMGASSTTVSWIFNVSQLFNQWSSITIGPLTMSFGYRNTGICVGFLVSLSLFISAFARTPAYFYFSFSILGGVGGGLTLSLPYIIVPQYFKRHLGRANVIMLVGINFGQILGPTFVRYLQDQFGFKGATIIMSAVFLHCCVGALFFHPVKWHMKPVVIATEEATLPIYQSEDKREYKDQIKPFKKVGSSPLLQVLDTESHNKSPYLHTQVLQAKKHKRIRTISERSVNTFMGSISGSVMNLKHIESDINLNSTQTDDKLNNKNSIIEREKPGIGSVFGKVIADSVKGLTILRSPVALILCFGGAFIVNAYLNFFAMIPFALQASGFELQSAAWCISTNGLVGLVTRILLCIVADRPWFNTRLVYIIGNAIMVLTTLVFPWMTSLKAMLAVMVPFSIGTSINLSLLNVNMVQLMGLENLPKVFGASKLITGICFIIIGPIIGMIRDASGSYVLAISILAGIKGLSFILWLFMPAAIAYDKRMKMEQQNEYA